MYRPRPLDTRDVELDAGLRALLERLAENHHDAWARDQMRAGWTHASVRDEAARTDSDLVPYAELAESGKERARQAAREVLQAIVALGFTIDRRVRVSDPAPSRAGDRPAADAPGSPGEELATARRRAEERLGLGEPLLAYECVEAALAAWPGDLRLRQLRGLALARCGAGERANRAMRDLREAGHEDAETLGILARTHKDLAARAPHAAERAAHLEQAYLAYRQGYDRALRLGNAEDAYFTGINAATSSLLLGQTERAVELARATQRLCQRELERSPESASYWLHATLAEAALVLGDGAEARRHYRRAAERAGTRWGDLSTTRRQARLVIGQRREDPSWIDELLRVPPLAVFTGHMIDRPERDSPRFPAEREKAVQRCLRRLIRSRRPAAAYASAACGADILFLEALVDEGCEFHVVLPVPPEEFVPVSVDVIPGGSWRGRFERVVAAAATVTAASDQHAADDAATLGYANLILTGMASLHAQRLETSLFGLAVWDGRRGDGPGGTAAVVRHWQSRGIAVERIDPGDPRDDPAPCPPVGSPTVGDGHTIDSDRQPLMAMLFADAVGYSRLREEQIPRFVEHFLGPIAALIESSPDPPVLKETAGDGLYLVFRNVRHAGLFALALRDRMDGVDWEERGLPPTLGIRVALHCGPVQRLIDPITGQPKYTGPHTSRAARIEPITPPGQVYASQAFAAVAAATGVDELGFEYVGRTALAKHYGSLPLYHVQRATPGQRRGRC